LSSLGVCHLLSVTFQFSYRQCAIACFSGFYHLIRPCELILHIWNIPYIVYIKVLSWCWFFFRQSGIQGICHSFTLFIIGTYGTLN